MRILVTAGPTREPLDPVRFLSNRSSGRMGYALAACAAARGHRVTLVSGPVSLPPPPGVTLCAVGTAQEMLEAVVRELRACDALVMAAAVCDWRPATVSRSKLKKRAGLSELPLAPTPDILAHVRPRKGRRIFVGFAAETGNPIAGARRKLREKGLDLIVANDVSQADSGFEVDTIRAVLVRPAAAPRKLPLLSKREAADRVLDWIEKKFGAARGSRRRNPKPIRRPTRSRRSPR